MVEVLNDHVIDAIPAYALGSLEPDERSVVDDHLAVCSACQEELAGFQDVVNVLPFAAAEAMPPADLKNRLLDQIRQPQSAHLAAQPAPRRDSGWQRLVAGLQEWLNGPIWRPVALAFVLLLIAANAFFIAQELRPRSGPWKEVLRLTGTDAAPEAFGVVYISGNGRFGTLVVDGLPILTDDQQYQMWLIDEAGARTSGAVFSVNEQGYRGIEIISEAPLDSFNSFGITVEPAGGSPQPTGQRVLGYNLNS